MVSHHAPAGTVCEVTRELHRMGGAVARAELDAAGFVPDADSDVLANTSDPRNDSAFAPESRKRY